MKNTGNTILVTGAGSGIGAALAQRFHDLGNTVIIAGRRREALEQTASGRANMVPIVLDVENAGAVAEFAKQVVAAHPALNVLINNAGIMKLEELGLARDMSDAEAMVATNLLGPIRLTNVLIDHLARRPDAAIVNVSSGLGFVPLTLAPTYSATKAAIHSYTVSLREVLKDKVEVIELVPPAVQTGLTPGQESRPGYMPLPAFIDEVMQLFAKQPTPPEILVERVGMQRFAEAEHRFNQTLTTLNDFARKAREAHS